MQAASSEEILRLVTEMQRSWPAYFEAIHDNVETEKYPPVNSVEAYPQPGVPLPRGAVV